MLKKRLVGMIVVKDGWAVQSFGYRRYLPLGRVQTLAENLDRWGVDEIIVQCIDRTPRGLGPDIELLRGLGSLGLSTPLTYGGGIRTAEDAGLVVQSGADRICIDATFHSSPGEVRRISALVGAQAVIGVLPLSVEQGKPLRRDYRTGRDLPLAPETMQLFEERVASEALIVDWRNEGRPNGFDMNLTGVLPAGLPLIAFGGISEPVQLDRLFASPRVVAVGIGNFLSYREHALQNFKRSLQGDVLRPASFADDV